MKFAKIVFRIAGIWGILILLPMCFLFDAFGRMFPPALNHPEWFYGFLCVGLAWQIVFLIIASDPMRFRPLMITAMLEKFPYVVVLLVLLAQGRIVSAELGGGVADFILGVLFVLAFLKTRPGSVIVVR